MSARYPVKSEISPETFIGGDRGCSAIPYFMLVSYVTLGINVMIFCRLQFRCDVIAKDHLAKHGNATLIKCLAGVESDARASGTNRISHIDKNPVRMI